MQWRNEKEKEICEGTIERFTQYIEQQLKGGKMEKELEMENTNIEQQENKNPFDDIGGDYLKLERDKAKVLGLMNWKVEKIKKFKDEKTGALKEQMEFSADVILEDGQPVKKIYTTTSYSALRSLKDIFSKYWPDNNRLVIIRIKKIGEGKSTIYDIEEQRPMK